MLVLKRQWGDVVYIKHKGETLTLITSQPNSETADVRVCFDGPRSFEIIRREAKVQERPNG